MMWHFNLRGSVLRVRGSLGCGSVLRVRGSLGCGSVLRVRGSLGSPVTPSLIGLALSVAALVAPTEARALDADEAVASASHELSDVAAELGTIQATLQKSRGQERGPAQRIADAILLMGSKDYARAANVLNETVEKYPDHPTAYPDALSLLGETYFRSKQFLSARRVFQQIVHRGSEPRFVPYQSKALGRLVDIALRTKDYASLDAIFASMDRVPPDAAGSGLAYARGKGLFAKKDYAGAKASLGAVDARSEYLHQAKYLLALIAVKEAMPPPRPVEGPANAESRPTPERSEGEAPPVVPASRYAAAIDLFQKVTQLPPDTADHRHVIDLAWLGIGRLFYEADQFAQAVQAYNRVDRASPEVGTMLYELAWVYVRLGEMNRAQKTLEILVIAEPNHQSIADGSLLRGDLLLRAGRFDKALKVYEGVRSAYDPMRERVDAFLRSTSDPAVYYDRLSQEQLDTFDRASALPPLAVQWAREAEDGPAAFAVIDDVNRCRELIKRSNEMIDKLNAVLGSPNRGRAFPQIKAGEEKLSLDLQKAVMEEKANIASYSARLEELDREARLIVGEVALRNFGLVHERLKSIVLRADVGITEEAWEVREEQGTRVRKLQVERAREDRQLREELNEVLEDNGDPEVEK